MKFAVCMEDIVDTYEIPYYPTVVCKGSALNVSDLPLKWCLDRFPTAEILKERDDEIEAGKDSKGRSIWRRC